MYRLKGASGPVINQVFSLQDVTVIGGDASCEVTVEGQGVAGRHVEIRVSPEGVVTALSLEAGHETLCNGVPITEQVLSPGDELRIGACRWVLQAPGMRPERVLTDAAISKRPLVWPWLLPAALAVAAFFAWRQGWLPF